MEQITEKGEAMYPENDNQYEDVTIKNVSDANYGWNIERSDGWIFHVELDSPIHPAVGMLARFYGKGFGFNVRGLYLNGVKVYYRTEEEDKKYQAVIMYGRDAADWLERWADGKGVWSIEMGGLGPGYEQCIQVTMAEILRHMIEKKYDAKKWKDKEEWQKDRDEIEKMGHNNPVIGKLMLSGAQWGAALDLACQFYAKGPCEIMADDRVKDRHIQISKNFP